MFGKDELYSSYLDQVILLEDLIDAEHNDQFTKVFGKSAIRLVEDMEKLVVGKDLLSLEDEDFSDQEYSKLIPAIKLLIEQIQDKKKELDDEKADRRIKARVASWSPEKQEAYKEFMTKRSSNR